MKEKWINLVMTNVVDEYEVSSEGKVRYKSTQKELCFGNEDRKKVTLRLKNGKSKRYPLDYVIATAFIPNPNNYIIIDHLDEDKNNCAAHNLQWFTCVNNPKYDTVENLEGEVWKNIEGFPNYSVSNLGRVKSHARDVMKNGSIVGIPKEAQIMTPTIEDRSGYAAVGLSVKLTTITVRVHKLVADAFIPNPENKPTIDHIDLNKLNNRVDNLRWATHKENNNNGGTSQIRVTSKDGNVQEFNSIKEASIKLGISSGTIKSYCSKARTPRNGDIYEYLSNSRSSLGQRSRRKGHAFEREVSHKLNDLGYDTCTSRQESKALDNNKIDIADLRGDLPTNIQTKYTSTTPNYFLIRELCSDKSKPFTLIWKKSVQGKHSPGTVAIIPIDFFYELLKNYHHEL